MHVILIKTRYYHLHQRHFVHLSLMGCFAVVQLKKLLLLKHVHAIFNRSMNLQKGEMI